MYWRTGQALIDQMERAARLDRRYGELQRRRLELDLESAKILQELEACDGWRCVGAASVADYGERRGVSAACARSQLAVGRALKAKPDLEEQVRRGTITFDSAALLGQVLPEPSLQREGDDWVAWAQSDSTKGFRVRVQRRKEEVALGTEEVVPISLVVAQKALDGFRRVREIASRKAGVLQTEGQTFGIMVETYRDVYDEERVKPGKRRMPHTSLVKGRYVPMSVVRAIYERQGRRCAVPYCDHAIYLDKAHLVPHRAHGSREAYNQVLLCAQHHVLFDAGYLKLTGTAENPRFTDREGRDLSRRDGGGELLEGPTLGSVEPRPAANATPAQVTVLGTGGPRKPETSHDAGPSSRTAMPAGGSEPP